MRIGVQPTVNIKIRIPAFKTLVSATKAGIKYKIPYTSHMIPLARLYFFISLTTSGGIFSPDQKFAGFLLHQKYIPSPAKIRNSKRQTIKQIIELISNS